MVIWPHERRCIDFWLIILQRTLELADVEVCLWKIECGKPLTEIHSSPFCNKTLLSSYCEFLHNIEVDLSHISVNILHIHNFLVYWFSITRACFM